MPSWLFCAPKGGGALLLILASASPRRAELLRRLGLDFLVVPSRCRETVLASASSPAEAVLCAARAKAEEVSRRYPEALVIAADTIVACSGRLLGKPRDAEEAREMLRLLSGRWHEVWTGVVVCHRASGRSAEEAVLTRVCFRDLTEAEIEGYIATGEPFDKAGSYAIQGYGGLLVERIEGCYTNVVGLPLTRLALMLRGFGVELFGRRVPPEDEGAS